MDLTALKGVSDKRKRDFAKLNIQSTSDLVRCFPRGYLDLQRQKSIKEVYHNDRALLKARLVRIEPVRYSGRVKYIRALLEQDGLLFSAVWFNMPYVKEKLKPQEYLFYGTVQNKFDRISLVNPTFEPVDSNLRLKGLVPVYPLRGTLTQRAFRDAVAEALKCESFSSAIPEPIQKKYALLPLEKAYLFVHAPKSEQELSEGSRRIALEEFFTLFSAFRLIKGNVERKNFYSATQEDLNGFLSRFPFSFTQGQKGAVEEIFLNLKGPYAMNRLLQGDVGSGKTAVALAGIFLAVKSGYQAVYLSPTEVLAEQNFLLIQKLFPEYAVGYLAGSSTAKEKREIKEKLSKGEIDILCGTHAVLQADVRFFKLSFCVCDEQHRFGVSQRSALSEKGEGTDVLVMSATPIPRTLSLIFYGDLDVTTIPDKPALRQTVSTSIILDYRYDDMLEYIAREAKAGKQAYFVCPKIEEDDGEIASALELFEELRGRLPALRFALLHGKMKDREKGEIMSAFKRGEYDCLVTTTVIEVGVDVPNATIMVIYNAERFGLSQLHQLRGRVGRGSEKSYCFLLVGTESETALERLKTLKETSDGFRLAEKDLEMRGSGDFFGTRQSGKFLNDIKNLRYSKDVIFEAKKLTDEAFEQKLYFEDLKRAAIEKYESLKDIVLN